MVLKVCLPLGFLLGLLESCGGPSRDQLDDAYIGFANASMPQDYAQVAAELGGGGEEVTEERRFLGELLLARCAIRSGDKKAPDKISKLGEAHSNRLTEKFVRALIDDVAYLNQLGMGDLASECRLRIVIELTTADITKLEDRLSHDVHGYVRTKGFGNRFDMPGGDRREYFFVEDAELDENHRIVKGKGVVIGLCEIHDWNLNCFDEERFEKVMIWVDSLPMAEFCERKTSTSKVKVLRFAGSGGFPWDHRVGELDGSLYFARRSDEMIECHFESGTWALEYYVYAWRKEWEALTSWHGRDVDDPTGHGMISPWR